MRRLPILLSVACVAGAGVTLAPALAGHDRDGKDRDRDRVSRWTLPGDRVFPEGIARSGNGFFVGSTTDGTIFRARLRSRQARVFAPPGADGRTTAVGMKARGGRLFVAGGGTGKAFVLSTKDGRTLRVLDSAPPGPTFLNDVALSRGFAWFTDSLRPVLLRAPVDGGPMEVFLDFTGTPFEYVEGFNANGIAARGPILLIIQSATGELFRVDTRTKEVSEVDLGGATLTNGDGLLLKGRTLYVVRNQQELIVPVRLSEGLRRGVVGTGRTSDRLRFPTTIARAGHDLLAVNAQFDKRSGTPELPFDVVRVAAPDRRSAKGRSGRDGRRDGGRDGRDRRAASGR